MGTNSNERLRILKLLIPIIVIDLSIGLFESFEIWRFPYSSLNPNVEILGRIPILDFSRIRLDKMEYLNSIPTGLRWGANNFIFGVLIYLFFIARFCKKRIFYTFLLIASFLCINASSRLVFWIGFPLVSFYILFNAGVRHFVFSLLSPFVVAYALIFMPAPINNKANECLLMPVKLAEKLLLERRDTFPIKKNKDPTQITHSTLQSETLRKFYFQITFLNFINSPILGKGPGNGSIDQKNKTSISPHFYLLEVFADFGILGGLLFLLGIACPVIRSRKNKNVDLPFHLIATALIGLSSVTLSSLVYYPLFFLMLSFLHSEISNDSIQNA